MNANNKIQHREGKFSGFGGLKLYEQWWSPPGTTKALVVIIHGLAEHSGRYEHVASYFGSHGYATGTFDLRAHGKSEGKNTFIRSFEHYLEDVDIFLDRAREQVDGKPLFLLGHSLGATIVTKYAIAHQPEVDGLLLSGVTAKLGDDIPPILIMLSGILGALLPGLPTIKIDSSAVSRDPQVVKRYDKDPLNYRGGIPARTGAELNRAVKYIQENSTAISLPIILMQGSEDKLSHPDSSQILYERIHSEDKTLKIYEGLYHEILNEPEKEQVMDDIIQWLDARL